MRALIKYGFGDVTQELGLDRLLHRGAQVVGLAKRDEALERLPQAVRLRRVLEELGPTFVKIGQILSTRPDLIPADWALEFRRLQDDVAPVSYALIRSRLEREFPVGLSEVFDSIEETPLAAASIAQVHRAVLKGGRPVVLKMLRPGIRAKIDADLRIMKMLADFTEERFANLGYSPIEVVAQFSRELRREVDLTIEARATDRFRRDFQNDPNVRFPYVYWEATTPSVLALEEIRGTRLSQMDITQVSVAERAAIVANGADAIFRQCLEHGFFHADPHPGNIFWVGEGGKICFIDCGMTGRVDPATTEQLADLIYGVANTDLNRVTEAVLQLSDADPNLLRDRRFRADVWEFISRFDQTTLAELRMGDMLEDFFSKVRRHRLRVPGDLVFLIKAIGTIEGVGEAIAPDFDVVAHVRPHVDRLVRKRYGVRSLRKRLQDSMANYARLLEDVPQQFRTLFFELRRHQFTINLEHRGLHRLTHTLERAGDDIAHALLVSSLILGSAILILADRAYQDPTAPTATVGEGAASQPSGMTLLTLFAVIGFGAALTMIVIRVIFRRFR